jgi:hypothetical protein
MSPGHRRLLGAAVVVAGIAIAVILALTIGRTPPNQGTPNPNGYDNFVQAGNLVVGDVSSFSDLGHDALRGLVSSNSEPLRLLRLGLTRRCSFPTDIALTNQSWMVAELPRLKRLAQLLRAEGQLAEMEGRAGDGANSYVEAIRFGNEISRGGFLINRLVGIACEAIGAVPLTKLVPSLGLEEACRVSRQLEKIDESRVSFDEIKSNERRFARHELFKHRNPLEWVTGLRDVWNATQRSATKDKTARAHERLLATQLALRCYQSDRGQVAARLDDLVTNYLAKVPIDPFTGQPLVYRPRAANWLLYSVGQDGVDDAGMPVGKGLSSSAKGDILFDSPW